MDALVSVAVVLSGFAQFVVTILLVVVLWYVIAILRNVLKMTERLERGSEMISSDLFAIRRTIKEEGRELWFGAKAFFVSVVQMVGFGAKKKRSRTKAAPDTDSDADYSS